MIPATYTIGGAVNTALNHFTKALAEEDAPRSVRVVGINLGPILTERLLKMRGGSNPAAAAQPPEEALQGQRPGSSRRPELRYPP